MTSIIAHRGFAAQYPENTMLAFQKALACGADGIELDVQMTKDGVPVICHDEDISRTSNGVGYLKDYTYAELCRLNFAHTFKGIWKKIPTLEEYATWVKETALITNIELKTNIFTYDGLVPRVSEIISRHGLESRTIYSSFNHETIREIKRRQPEIPCGFLTDCRLLQPEDYCRQRHVECYHPNYLHVTYETVQACHACNIAVNPYTVDKPEDIQRFLSWQTDGIITNNPALALSCKIKQYG